MSRPDAKQEELRLVLDWVLSKKIIRDEGVVVKGLRVGTFKVGLWI